jgi:hypothetical protein
MDVTFGNITPHGPRAFVVPGPQGAVATPQLEMLREGMQLSETVAMVRRLLADEHKSARLGATRVREIEETIQSLMDVMESNRRMSPRGGGDVRRLVHRVYQLAGEVAGKD